MKDLNAVLSAVVVVALVLVVLLLGVKTYTTGSSLDSGWVTLLCLVFGGVIGVPAVQKAREKQEADKAEREKEKGGEPKNET